MTEPITYAFTSNGVFDSFDGTNFVINTSSNSTFSAIGNGVFINSSAVLLGNSSVFNTLNSTAWTGIVNSTSTLGSNISGQVSINGLGSGFGQIDLVDGNYGVLLRNDGSDFYFLQTASGNQYGTWNSFRPFHFNLTSGAVSIDGTGAGTNVGGALTITGAATAPTPSAGDNSTNLATTAFVSTAFGGFGAWTTYTPTITIAGGSATATGRYKQVGKTVFIQVAVNAITTGGTSLIASIPAGMSTPGTGNPYFLVGRENAVNGFMWMGYVNGSSIQFIRYDNNFPVTAGWQITLSGSFEIV